MLQTLLQMDIITFLLPWHWAQTSIWVLRDWWRKQRGRGCISQTADLLILRPCFLCHRGKRKGTKQTAGRKGNNWWKNSQPRVIIITCYIQLFTMRWYCSQFHLTKFLKYMHMYCDKYQRPFYKKTGGGGCLMSKLHVPQSI